MVIFGNQARGRDTSFEKPSSELNRSFVLSNGGQRKDAMEEYFRMTVLAVKLAMPEVDRICMINAKLLYERAR